jgi:protease IV
MTTHSQNNDNNTLATVLNAFVREQRLKRRWGLFFKLIILTIAVILLLSHCSHSRSLTASRNKPHTALIELNGEISAKGPVDANIFAGAIRSAYKDKGTKGIILRINSPGGSPVQSDYIYNEIMRLRKKHPNIPVYAVCTDMCASGAYFIASSANYIYANPSSLVGSIGVIMSGFGFQDAIKKLGVERRVFIAGKYKDFLDPFSNLSPAERKYAQEMVDSVHQQFIAAVEAGRGKRLHRSKDIFSGMAWTGIEAKKRGLIDGFGSAGSVARDVIKQEKIINYTVKANPFDKIADKLGESFANVVMTKLETPNLNG